VRGKYLKAAERACAAKARFDTKELAERTAEYRYRAYQCPICHHWHLTSQAGAAEPPKPEKPAPPLARLGDLPWKELKPRGEPGQRNQPVEPVKKAAKPAETQPQSAVAVVKSLPDRHHRVLIVLNLRLVKSEPLDRELRGKIRVGDTVVVDGHRVVEITEPKLG
jgi:hypothetical protein